MSHAYMPQDQILELGRRWAKAELHKDTDVLASLLDPDFICVGPVGFVINKEQYLGGRRSGDLKHEAFAWEDVRVRVYGDAAITVGSQFQTSTFQGRDASARLRATQVLIRKGESWVIATLHLSPITPAPAWMLAALQTNPMAQSQGAPAAKANRAE